MPAQSPILERVHRGVRDVAGDLARLARADTGATMAEYALLIAVVALVALAGAKTFGTSVGAKFTSNAARVANP